MRRHQAILVALVASLCVPVASQQPATAPAYQEPPPISFKVEVNYVEVGAVVTDAQGQFVRTLNSDDFQILEDGRPQKIAAFSLVDIPVRHARQPILDRQAIEPDVSSNGEGFQGRLYVIVLDDLHTDLSRSGLVKAAARRFIEHNLADNDIAAVVPTSGRFEGVQDFTPNRRLLLAAVDTFVGQKLRSAVLERLDNYRQQFEMTGQDPGLAGKTVNDALDVERGQRARNTLLTLRNLADSLSIVHGRRKAMVYISEGIDYTTSNFEQWRELSGNARTGVTIDDALRDAVTTASRANVSIYAVDPRGLTNLGDTAMEINYMPEDPSLRLDSAGLLDELRRSQDHLRVLAEETGGIAAVNTNDLSGAFDRVVRENSSYYMLGYYPTNERRDGRFRRIEVRMNRPGLQVRARRGYVLPRNGQQAAASRLPKAEGSTELADALSRPIETSRLTLRTTATVFKGSASNASVALAITVDGKDFTFQEKDGWIEDKLEVSVRAIDPKGTIRGSEHFDLNIRIRPESRRILNDTGFRAISNIDVPPGKYRLHIGVRETGGRAVGTVFTDLEVADFAASRMAMSSLILSSVQTGGVPTGRAELVRDRLPVLPSTTRVFRSDDEVVMFAEVYDNDAATPHTVDIIASILAEDGTTLVREREEMSGAQLRERPGARFGTTIPLKELKPGVYVAKVEAASRLDSGAKVAREVPFRITP